MTHARLLLSGGIALGVYVILDALEPFLALPLRESSSRVAEFLLSLLALPITRHGTILSTPNFTFDVVPACSGSTTLRVLLTASIIWCAIHPRLTLGRRLGCVALCVPVALGANGVRVAALAGLGDLLLKPIEGLPHALIGVGAFGLAMAVVYLVTAWLAQPPGSAPRREGGSPASLALALALLYAPVGLWCVSSWSAFSHERLGLPFVLVGAISLIWLWFVEQGRESDSLGGRTAEHTARRSRHPKATPKGNRRGAKSAEEDLWRISALVASLRFIGPSQSVAQPARMSQKSSLESCVHLPHNFEQSSTEGMEHSCSVSLVSSGCPSSNLRPWTARSRIGVFGFGLSVVLYSWATFVDIRLLQAGCFLAGLFALALALKGVPHALRSLPLLAIMALGMPMTSHVLATVLERLSNFTGLMGPFLLKLAAALALGTLFWWIRSRAAAGQACPASGSSLPGLTLLALLGLAFQGYCVLAARQVDQLTRLELGYHQGDWLGTDNPVSEVAASLLGRERIVSRRYVHQGEEVAVIVTSTGADRRRAHPPEGCMVGTGWTARSQRIVAKRVGARELPVTEFRFQRGDQEVLLCYWFTDGPVTCATFREMLREDLRRRLRGTHTNWYLFRVIAPTRNRLTDEFLLAFHPLIHATSRDRAGTTESWH